MLETVSVERLAKDRHEHRLSRLRSGGRLPSKGEAPTGCRTVSQVQTDQSLIRHAEIGRERLEVGDGRLVEADRNLAPQPSAFFLTFVKS